VEANLSFLKPKAPKSDNQNNALITQTYGGSARGGVTANNYLTSLLTGTGDTGAANAGYNNYLQMAGYAPAMRQMTQGITGQGAARGLLNSGSTTRRLQQSGAELNQGFYNNYLQQLTGVSGLGLQAGGLIANTGSRSTGGGPSTAGSIASTIGGIASIFSDRRLKRNITLLRRDADGLGWYEFAYLWEPAKRIVGVMADEVAKLRPHALGPQRLGYATVDYGAL
jgi:hypothetical protein